MGNTRDSQVDNYVQNNIYVRKTDYIFFEHLFCIDIIGLCQGYVSVIINNR